MSKQTYTPAQMKSAEQMARTLLSVPEDQRNVFRMMVDAMLVGATITNLLDGQRIGAAIRPGV